MHQRKVLENMKKENVCKINDGSAVCEEVRNKSSRGRIILAIIFLIISVMGITFSALCMDYADRFGIDIWGGNQSYVMREINKELLRKYSIDAMEDYADDFDMEYLSKTNFRYGVIKTDNFDEIDITDKSNYLVNNFDANFNKDNVNIYSCYMDKNTEVRNNLSLFGHSYINNYSQFVSKRSAIVGYKYNVTTQKFYYETESEKLFEENAYFEETGAYLDNSYLSKNRDGEWYDAGQTLRLESSGYIIKLQDVDIISYRDTQSYEMASHEDLSYYIEDGYISYEECKDYEDESYYVISYVASPLDYNSDDLFVLARKYTTAMYEFRWAVPVVMVLSIVICVICVLYLAVRIIKSIVNIARQNVSLFFRGCAILCAIAVLEFFIVLAGEAEGAILIFIAEKIVLYPIILCAILQINKIMTASKRMVEGESTTQIDCSRMFFDFKKIGENLNSLGKGINAAVEERMKSERFKTELITNVSHDIKTPLTSIINYVDLLQVEGVTEEEQKEYLEILSRQSDKLKKLIEDLIEASKAATGNIKIEPEILDVSVALTQIIGEYKEKLSENNIELYIKTPDQSVNIEADAKHLQRVFDNLMINIYKYALPGTRAFVSIECTDNTANIIFRNTSKQLLSMDSEELLQRFSRGDASRNTDGHGLGLSIAQSLTEVMGGHLQIFIDGDLFKVVLTFEIK